MKTFVNRILIVLCLCTLASPMLLAQSVGTVSGMVTDAQGALLPNVKVELENTSTGNRLSAVSDSNGRYRFTDVPAGRYRVLMSSTSSSAPAPTQELTVEVGRENAINLTMSRSGPGTDALVSTETVPVSMSPANIQRNFDGRMIQGLPQPNLLQRDGQIYGAYNLGTLTEATNTPTIDTVRGPAVAGQRPISNNYHVDGIDNNNKINPGPLVYVSPEATTEFALFQNQPTPNFGHSAGGQFNSIVRSGNNRVHGSIYDFFQNRNLNAVDQSYARQGLLENPRYDQNRFGASLGLPIIPSKLFFFGNFEYIPLGFERPLGGVTYAPTAAGFATLANIPGISSSNLGILRSTFSNVGAATQTTTVNGVTIPLGMVQNTVRGWQNQYNGTGSMDFTPYDKDQMHLRYVHNEVEANNVNYGLGDFATPTRYRSLLASAGWYHSFANAVVNELRLGYNRFNQLQPGPQSTFGSLAATPNINIQNTNLSLGQQLGFLQGGRMNTYHLADTVAMRFGRHEVRLGFDGRRYLGNSAGLANQFGNYTYSNLGRYLQDLPPDVYAQRGFGNTSYINNQWLFAGFLHDTITIKPNLSLTLGVRYNYTTVPEGVARQQSNAAALGTALGDYVQPVSPTDNWSPYAGLAWSPTFSRWTVFRAGYSWRYDYLYGQQFSNFFVPQFGANVYGNLNSNTPGFLAGGGIQNPYNGGTLTNAQARALTTGFVNGNLRTPYSQEWNAAWQQAIWRQFTMEVKYIGSRGMHMPVYTWLNNPGIVTAQNSLPLYYSAPSQATLNSLPLTLNQLRSATSANPLVQAGFTSPLTTIMPDGRSWYHGLAITLSHRFTGGFQMLGNYTWSHLIDDATGTYLDLYSNTRMRGNSIYDRRHVANVTAMWDVAGLFKNQYNWVRNIFADVTVSGTYSFRSPQYLTPLSGSNADLSGFSLGSPVLYNSNGAAGVGSGLNPLTNAGGQVVAYQVNNPNARFISTAPGVYANNPGRNFLSLGDIHNFDVSAVKRFSYADRFSFEVRGDAYNVLNHPQFIGSRVNTVGFSQPGSVPNFLIPGMSQFADFQGNLSSNARLLQLSLRVVF